MKRLIICLFCVLITLNMFSITEVPKELFPTLSGLQRTSFYDSSDDCYDNYSTLNTPIETIAINDKLYVRFGDWCLREENNQVLIYSSAYQKDFVLYDWSLAVGDSLSYLGIDSYSYEAPSVVDYFTTTELNKNGELIVVKETLDKIVVTEVSTITLLDGKEYKKWVFNTGYIYVEGIGSFSNGNYFHLIIPEFISACYLGEYLVCVSKNDQLLYTIEKDVQKRLGAACQCLNEGIETNVENINTPSPSFHKTLHEGQLLIQADGKTYNIMGVEVK